MKIQLRRGNDKKSLCLTFNINDVSTDIDFWRSDLSEVEMVLLKQYIEKAFGDHMQEIRSVSYRRGWNDHKRKQSQAGWFARCHELLDWEKK